MLFSKNHFDGQTTIVGVPELVVYTKIPKTGSTTIMELMRNLTLLFKRYHFHYTPTFNYVKDRDSNFTFVSTLLSRSFF